MNVTNTCNIQCDTEKHDWNDIHAWSSDILVILNAGVASDPSRNYRVSFLSAL